MKLLRHGEVGDERPGILLADGRRRDLSGRCREFDGDFLASGGLGALREQGGFEGLPEVDPEVRWATPLARPGKIICIGLNYRDHALETGKAIPTEPIVFMKATSALNGPRDPLVLPRGSEKTDWEVELAVVIGKDARYVDEEEAMGHVAGYCLHNDYSERHFQYDCGGQWVKGKSCDTFAALGPLFVTTDEVPDPQALHLWLDVNGERRQDGTTADQIFSVPRLVSYLSTFMTLEAGDIISTGTPAGVGAGMKPPQFLKPGDVVSCGVEGLGEQRQEVVSPL
jgi:2-keto-4-pentenoate hydratase/2-oxohepta-3-ene-1,7-dioic acid hydratase in catechol pathway